MKVQELKQKLEEYPDDMEVVFYSEEHYWPVLAVDLDTCVSAMDSVLADRVVLEY